MAARDSSETMRERAFVPVLVYVGTVVSIISSLGAPLIPSIARDLDASLCSAQWSLTATLLVGAVATPVVGRLGDGRHRRTVTLVCLAIVAVGGALAAIAGSLPVLVAGRAMQGVGLALMPLTMAAARDHLSDRRAPGVIALLSVVAAVGVGLGYPITGFIAENASLETAFWAGTAMTVLAFIATALVLPETSDAAHRGRLDVAGAVTIAIGLVCLLIACEKGPDWGWASTDTLGLLALSLVFLGLFGVRELSTTDPLVDLRLVRHRVVLTANVVGGVLGMAMYIAIALMTQFVQLSTPERLRAGRERLHGGADARPALRGQLRRQPVPPRAAAADGPARGARGRLPRGRLGHGVLRGDGRDALAVARRDGDHRRRPRADLRGAARPHRDRDPAQRDRERDGLLPGVAVRRVLDRQRPEHHARARVRRPGLQRVPGDVRRRRVDLRPRRRDQLGAARAACRPPAAAAWSASSRRRASSPRPA